MNKIIKQDAGGFIRLEYSEPNSYFLFARLFLTKPYELVGFNLDSPDQLIEQYNITLRNISRYHGKEESIND